MAVITLLVGLILQYSENQADNVERLKKENATVLLQIQADMLGYHVVRCTPYHDS